MYVHYLLFAEWLAHVPASQVPLVTAFYDEIMDTKHQINSVKLRLDDMLSRVEIFEPMHDQLQKQQLILQEQVSINF